LPGSLCHLISRLSKQRGIRCPNVEHLNSLWLYACLSQQLLCLLNPFLCSKISFQEMTIAFLSPSDEDGISAILEGFKQMECIHLPCAQEFHYAHVG